MSTQEKKTPAASTATDVQLLRKGKEVVTSHSITSAPDSQVTGRLPAGWSEWMAELHRKNRLIVQGICPNCGGTWGDGPKGHEADCPSARPVTRKLKGNGRGRGWRRGRGRERHSSRHSRMTAEDKARVRARGGRR
jgi:hypothetical protein